VVGGSCGEWGLGRGIKCLADLRRWVITLHLSISHLVHEALHEIMYEVSREVSYEVSREVLREV